MSKERSLNLPVFIISGVREYYCKGRAKNYFLTYIVFFLHYKLPAMGSVHFLQPYTGQIRWSE